MQEAPNNAKELKLCLEAAFADAVYPGDDHLTISGCSCAECRETRDFFQSRHWQELVEMKQSLMFLWGGLAILTPQAWRFYLPGYLISGLGEGIADWTEQNKAEGARQAALWSLSPLGNNTESRQALFAERTDGFSFAQQQCIAAYAQAMWELEPEEENYTAAAAYWKDRTTPTSTH